MVQIFIGFIYASICFGSRWAFNGSVGFIAVYGLISVAVMLSAAVTGCNNKNNISEGSIKTEAVQSEGIISQKRAVSQMLMTSRQIFMLSHR